MRRARVFAAPFVVTAALSGCEDHSRSKEKEQEPPPARPDAVLKTNPPQPTPDAQMSHNPPMPLPDAAPLAEAPAGATTIQDGATCYVFGDRQQVVRCPDEGATLTLPAGPRQVGDISVDSWSLGCREFVAVNCPPPDQGTCNPPPPHQVPCPQELLPTLRSGLDVTRTGADCVFHIDGADDVAVVCPPKLPDAPKDKVVYARDGGCWVSDYAEVACPKGGAPLILPDDLSVELGSGSISLYTSSMTCFQEEAFDCPQGPAGTTHTCNPPAPAPVACPDELLPHVRAGVKTKKHDGKCWYQDVEVACP